MLFNVIVYIFIYKLHLDEVTEEPISLKISLHYSNGFMKIKKEESFFKNLNDSYKNMLICV